MMKKKGFLAQLDGVDNDCPESIEEDALHDNYTSTRALEMEYNQYVQTEWCTKDR